MVSGQCRVWEGPRTPTRTCQRVAEGEAAGRARGWRELGVGDSRRPPCCGQPALESGGSPGSAMKWGYRGGGGRVMTSRGQGVPLENGVGLVEWRRAYRRPCHTGPWTGRTETHHPIRQLPSPTAPLCPTRSRLCTMYKGPVKNRALHTTHCRSLDCESLQGPGAGVGRLRAGACTHRPHPCCSCGPVWCCTCWPQ